MTNIKRNMTCIIAVIFASMFLHQATVLAQQPQTPINLRCRLDWNHPKGCGEHRDNPIPYFEVKKEIGSLHLYNYSSQEADIYIQDKRNRTVFKQSVGTNDSMLEISTVGLRPGVYYIYILTDDEMWYGSFEI